MADINPGEYKSSIGLDKVHIAEVTKDDASGYNSGEPEYFAPVAKASAKTPTASKTQYADDGAYDTVSSESETTLEIEVTGLPLSLIAKTLGKTYNETNGMYIHGSGTAAPDYALSFRSKKSNGKYRYIQYLKGKFSMSDEEFKTLEESPEPITAKMTYTAIQTIYEFSTAVGKKERVKYTKVDEDVAASAALAAGWFTQVNVPATVGP